MNQSWKGLADVDDFPGLNSLLASLVGMELAVKRLNPFSGRRVAFALLEEGTELTYVFKWPKFPGK